MSSNGSATSCTASTRVGVRDQGPGQVQGERSLRTVSVRPRVASRQTRPVLSMRQVHSVHATEVLSLSVKTTAQTTAQAIEALNESITKAVRKAITLPCVRAPDYSRGYRGRHDE